jgi:hypothetical protein
LASVGQRLPILRHIDRKTIHRFGSCIPDAAASRTKCRGGDSGIRIGRHRANVALIDHGVFWRAANADIIFGDEDEAGALGRAP